MSAVELSLLISTYQRPWHLWRSLLAVSLQRGVEGKFEVIVTDDGSTDETGRVVEAFARRAAFPVKFTTHENDGFRLARCRNEGVAIAAAPYLLFTDADCLLPPDHLAIHLRWRRRGMVMAGDCYRLGRVPSQRVNEQTIKSGEYLSWISGRERLRLFKKGLCARITSPLRIAMRPRLTGCNIALWRDDYERINGFDENYVGWGLEDRDLQKRLGLIGLRFRSIVLATAACHLWHRAHPTFARNNEGTANLRYFQREEVPIRCRNGLIKEGGDDLADAPQRQGHPHASAPHFPGRIPMVTPWETARRGE
jgi:glycosyltransferase involved in cell wall biosynthesis